MSAENFPLLPPHFPPYARRIAGTSSAAALARTAEAQRIAAAKAAQQAAGTLADALAAAVADLAADLAPSPPRTTSPRRPTAGRKAPR